VFVRAGVVVAVVEGAAVGATVGAAVVDAALGVGLGASVDGAAVRIWTVGLGDVDADALALGDGVGELEVPAKRASPPPRITPMRRSVRSPPASAARMRSMTRGPRRGGGMIFVVSDDITGFFRTWRAGTSARRSLDR
jgi:hypothetical protein